jgi:hypothetical protein
MVTVIVTWPVVRDDSALLTATAQWMQAVAPFVQSCSFLTGTRYRHTGARRRRFTIWARKVVTTCPRMPRRKPGPVQAGSTSRALSEARSRPEGLELKPRQGRDFYNVIAASMLISLALNLAGY